jgi:hypothetical protein
MFAGVLPIGANHHGNPAAVLVPQAGGIDERGRGDGAARREPRRKSGFGLLGREQKLEGLDGVGQLVLIITDQALPGRRDPAVGLVKIDLERAELTVGAQGPQALIVGERRLLDLLALRDVEVQADDAFERSVVAEDLHAQALDPHPAPEPVFHAELDGEWARAGGRRFLGELVGRRPGVVRVEELQPGVVGVGQLGVDVAEQLFPGRRVVDAVALEIQVEEAERASIHEEGKGLGRRIDRRQGGRRDRRDGGEIPARRTADFFQPHEHLARVALPRLGLQRDRLAGGGGGQHVPLGIEKIGFLGDDIEGEQTGENPARKIAPARLPERAGGGIGHEHAAAVVEDEDRHRPGGGHLSRRRT